MYYVDRQHPGASDENPGTEEAPFLTIQRGAEAVGPAEKVLIKSGVYRERVHPLRGGTGADGMIAFEAAPGAEAVIRGSRVLTATWTNMEEPNSVHVWRTELPESFFAGDHPFAVINTTDEDFELMRWARGSKGKAPHNLPRALVFQDGRRLTQLSSIADLARITGAFWIDSENRKLYVNPFDGRDPHTCEFEATAQQFLFCPRTTGAGGTSRQGADLRARRQRLHPLGKRGAGDLGRPPLDHRGEHRPSHQFGGNRDRRFHRREGGEREPPGAG